MGSLLNPPILYSTGNGAFTLPKDTGTVRDDVAPPATVRAANTGGTPVRDGRAGEIERTLPALDGKEIFCIGYSTNLQHY